MTPCRYRLTGLRRSAPGHLRVSQSWKPNRRMSSVALFQLHHLELVRLAVLMVGDLATAEDPASSAAQLTAAW